MCEAVCSCQAGKPHKVVVRGSTGSVFIQPCLTLQVPFLLEGLGVQRVTGSACNDCMILTNAKILPSYVTFTAFTNLCFKRFEVFHKLEFTRASLTTQAS